MNDQAKNKSQLIAEVQELRRQVAQLQLTAMPWQAEVFSEDQIARARQNLGITTMGVRGEGAGMLPKLQLAEALRQCEARLNEVQYVAQLGYYFYNVANNTTLRSANLLAILGIDEDHPQSVEGWLSIIHPDHLTEMAEYFTRVFTDRTHFDKEYRIIHGKSGESRWVHGLGQLSLDDAGNPIALFGTIQDITERKAAEEALLQSNKTYRNLIDGMNETVWVISPELKFLDINRTATEVMQYTREELLTMGPLDIDAQLNADMIDELGSTMPRDHVQVFETVHRTKDGRRIPVEIQSTLVAYQGQDAFLSIARDITERKEAEEALRKSEETYRNIIDGMKEAVWVIDFDGKFIDANRAAGEMLHYSRAELLTMGPSDIDPNLTTAVVNEIGQRNLKDRIRIFETLHIRKDGTVIPVEIQSTIITYQGRDVILSISRDITERKRTEQVLHQSEATNRLLARVVQQTGESIVITDLGGQIEYVNPAYEALTGYRADEVLGQKLDMLRRPIGDSPSALSPLALLQQSETWHGRYVDKRRDGSRYDVDASIFPIHDTDGRVIKYCKIARDISHELQLERQLSQSQRLETIGTLAGGIAHDFNNMLTPIMGYAEMAASTLRPTDPLRTYLQQILNGASRARDLVKQILTFSRQHDPQRQPLSLHVVIKEVLKLMRPSIPSTIDIQLTIDPACQKVLADATQIHQVLVNLCTNAFQAMAAHGGLLTIALEQVEIDLALAQLHPNLRQKEYARLTVSDSGIGMDRATMERIFEPFFTTKSVQEGTGLGLSVAHGIIRAHDGALLVRSEPGKGAAFQIYLPIFVDDLDSPTEQRVELIRGKETILLVDDEQAVTEIMQLMLEWLGYQVEAYNSSVEAFTIFQQQPKKYDLIISDLTMPGMTGVDLAKRVQEVRSGMPVVIITGYGNHLDAQTQKSYGIKHVAGKPIVINELALLIRQVLDT